MPSLKEYRRKRDFKKTTEPAPKLKSSSSGHSYLIQKHDASRLHYDFRLEHNGVLLSWAIPKGPSLVPGDKRLAVHVEDHPLEYGSFEGTIPEDQYGGGTVMLWDRGEWEPLKDPDWGLEHGLLEFRLHGEKLQGNWVLTRMGPRGTEGKENWLLIKRRDEAARSAKDPDILKEQPLSITTGRSLPEIANENSEVWESHKPSSKAARTRRAHKKEHEQEHARPVELNPSELSKARKAPFPDSIKPQLATLASEVPAGESWLHEIKFDGYRLICMIDNGKVHLITRNGNDWTRKFPQLVRAIGTLDIKQAVLDGELVALSSKGISDFQTLQNALSGGNPKLAYYVFDMPYCEGYDISRAPLTQRKRLLRDLLESTNAPELKYSDHIRGSGQAVFDNACKMGMEGIVCKRADSVYEQKRSKHWLKVKCVKRQELVVCGYTDPAGSRSGFGSLLLGYYEGGKLVYCGHVGTGFNEKLLRELHKRLSGMQVKSPPVNNPPKGVAGRRAHWVSPELVAEVEFTEWTQEGMLRHPSFVGLREDKAAKQVVRESVKAAAEPSPPKTPRMEETGDSAVAGVQLTNPDRVLYPEQGLTKLQLCRFYESIADYVVPHVINRPLAIVRCPRGRSEKCFFQKHISESLPESIKSMPIREAKGVQQTLVIEDLAGLVGLVQVGALEIHLWGSRADDVERPDRVVFDLDPGPGVEWEEVNEAAILVRDYLDDLGLVSFVKTSGGKGLHVIAPIARRQEWPQIKDFSEAVARAISDEHPNKYLANMSKSKRQGRIFIDYLRNGRGNTSVAPYSTRSRVGAPVSTPVAWNELSSELKPDAFTVENLLDRLKHLKKDPWKDFFKIRQSITAKAMKKLSL